MIQEISEMFDLDILSNTELYKISVMGGIALHPDNRPKMQSYINEVIKQAFATEEFASYNGVKQVLWNYNDTCMALRKKAAINTDMEQDFSHWETFDFLTRGLVDIGKATFLGHFDAFISSMNDRLLLHASMAMPGATKLREHYLGTTELNHDDLIAGFKSEVAKYVVKFNSEYVNVEDYFKRANESLDKAKEDAQNS